jgi:hypothetical protein
LFVHQHLLHVGINLCICELWCAAPDEVLHLLPVWRFITFLRLPVNMDRARTFFGSRMNTHNPEMGIETIVTRNGLAMALRSPVAWEPELA